MSLINEIKLNQIKSNQIKSKRIKCVYVFLELDYFFTLYHSMLLSWFCSVIHRFMKSILTAVLLLTDVQWDILVLDHMLDLSSHSEEEQNNEVDQQDRPEYRNIEDSKYG